MPFVVANGVRTHFREVGEGPPLLLIAGNGMEHTTFDEQLPSFSRHFRCIVYDLRGIGRSDVAEAGYDTRTLAADALALLDGIGVREAHVAGYSLGGAIGQEIAAAAPERVLSLSLYSSFDRPDPYLRLRYDLLVRIALESSPEVWALFSAFSAFGADYIDAHEAAVREHDSTARLGRIACPTWIAVGSADPVMPPSYSQRLQAAIAGSRLEIFPDRPHRILNFQAESFTERALAFLLEQRRP